MSNAEWGGIRQLEAMGMRVRFVPGLAEGAIYDRKHGIVIIDSEFTPTQCDAVAARVTDSFLEWELQRLLHHQ